MIFEYIGADEITKTETTEGEEGYLWSDPWKTQRCELDEDSTKELLFHNSALGNLSNQTHTFYSTLSPCAASLITYPSSTQQLLVSLKQGGILVHEHCSGFSSHFFLLQNSWFYE